jgi:metal-responsive CopG/Arc/MetJ family transcriptional regulator
VIVLGVNDLVNRTRIGSSIDNKLYEDFKKLSAETRIPQSKLLDEAIEDLLKKYGKIKDT